MRLLFLIPDSDALRAIGAGSGGLAKRSPNTPAPMLPPPPPAAVEAVNALPEHPTIAVPTPNEPP